MQRDEKGAVLLLAVVGVIVAMISCALAVDIGMVEQLARENQKIADLAALDGSKVLPVDPTSAVLASATRNGYSGTPQVACASSAAGPFTLPCASGSSGALKVTVASAHKNAFPFVGAGGAVTRRATAGNLGRAGFSMGSGLASVDTNKTVLNALLGDMLNGSINILSYNGLATSTLTLSALQTQLLAMGLAVGTPTQLLDADLTAAQLYQATGNALVLQGDTVNAAIFCSSVNAALLTNCQGTSVASRTTVTQTFKLRNLIAVASGSESNTLGAKLNLFQLLTGSAELANGTSAVAIPAISLGLGNVGNATGTMTLIEKPQMYFGPPGLITDPAHVTTSQVDLSVSANLLNILGVVTSTVTVRVTGGTAHGWLTQARCGPPATTIVHAVTDTMNSAISVTLLGIPLLPAISLNTLGTTADLNFTHPNPAQQSVGTTSLNLTSGLLSALQQAVVVNISTKVVLPILDSLGLSVGNADVVGLDTVTCTRGLIS